MLFKKRPSGYVYCYFLLTTCFFIVPFVIKMSSIEQMKSEAMELGFYGGKVECYVLQQQNL